MDVEAFIEALNEVKQKLILVVYSQINTWITYKFNFVSCQVLGYSVVVLLLALFSKHVLGSQLG